MLKPEKQSLEKSIHKLLKPVSYITLGNLIVGAVVIRLATLERFALAGMLLLLGAILDTLDGWLARKLNQISEYGAQLDTLADLVTFGISPFVIIVMRYSDVRIQLIAFLIPICAGLRLARYNMLRAKKHQGFVGVPVGLSTVVGVLAVLNAPGIVVAIVCLALCWLFISTLQLPRLI